MAAATADRNTPARSGRDFVFPLNAAKKAYAGAIAVLNGAYCEPATTALSLRAVGVFQEQVDNTAGAAGAVTVKVARGVFRLGNSAAGDAITLSDVGNDCYLVDDQTVAKTSGTNTRSVAGKVRYVDAAGVWVEF